ncbi:recombinase family protein [Microcystis aeruginosa]|uniref:recombinase family protein n=1 Tax=Microcystis aeruginosa TaxID=1126 RepID=UPI00187F649F|nr:recombinase family protein [Microcystis aeruginosa]MBE8993140.1 recombinase family protein [Microcystis aeruginosa LEGE 91341]
MTATPSNDLSAWERLEQGRQAKASNGGYAGYGSPAFGQRSIDGELVDDPEECLVIELIRRHHKSGKSLQKIADWLNEQGYTTKRGLLWQRISVKRVLDRLYGKVSRISGVTLQADQNPEVLTPASGDAAPETIRG